MITYRPWRLKRDELAFYTIYALSPDFKAQLVLYITVPLTGTKRNFDDAAEVMGSILRDPTLMDRAPTKTNTLAYLRKKFYKQYPGATVENVTLSESDILNYQFVADPQSPYSGEFVKIPLEH